MYLHIGGDLVIPFQEIVSILNYDTVKFGDKEENDAKSIIVTEKNKKKVVYYSNINAKTLLNRFECFLEGDSVDVIRI